MNRAIKYFQQNEISFQKKILSLNSCIQLTAIKYTYLSNDIATSVKTDVATVTFPIKLLTEQYTLPNGQSEFNI